MRDSDTVEGDIVPAIELKLLIEFCRLGWSTVDDELKAGGPWTDGGGGRVAGVVALPTTVFDYRFALRNIASFRMFG